MERALDKFPQDRGGKAKRDSFDITLGEYRADYSELTSEELSSRDDEADALIARSRIISRKSL